MPRLLRWTEPNDQPTLLAAVPGPDAEQQATDGDDCQETRPDWRSRHDRICMSREQGVRPAGVAEVPNSDTRHGSRTVDLAYG